VRLTPGGGFAPSELIECEGGGIYRVFEWGHRVPGRRDRIKGRSQEKLEKKLVFQMMQGEGGKKMPQTYEPKVAQNKGCMEGH